jgi:hypothetical protein
MQPDLMGYPSVEALVQAKRAGDAEAKRLFDENQKKDQLLAQLVTTAGNQRSVPDRHATPQDRLTDFGIPVDALGEIISNKVGEALQPLSQGLQARQAIVGAHPDYVQWEHEVANFINTDPDLSVRYPRIFAADPVSAMELAFLKFTESRRQSIPSSPQASQGRADAGIPTSRAGDARREPGGDAAIADALERFNRTGSPRDARAYAVTRLGPLLEQQFQRAGQTLGPQS